jgi:hypothetical protein
MDCWSTYAIWQKHHTHLKHIPCLSPLLSQMPGAEITHLETEPAEAAALLALQQWMIHLQQQQQ